MFNEKEYKHQWYLDNIDRIRIRRKQRYWSNPEYYRKYSKKYNQINMERIRERNEIFYQEHKKLILNRNKKWYVEHKDEANKKMRDTRRKMRIAILNVISNNNPHCVRCGCDDIRLLEINHKNGGGRKDTHNGKCSIAFYRDIYKGKREIDDLELLCKVCNSWHYLELKYGKLPYEVLYGNKD